MLDVWPGRRRDVGGRRGPDPGHTRGRCGRGGDGGSSWVPNYHVRSFFHLLLFLSQQNFFHSFFQDFYHSLRLFPASSLSKGDSKMIRKSSKLVHFSRVSLEPLSLGHTNASVLQRNRFSSWLFVSPSFFWSHTNSSFFFFSSFSFWSHTNSSFFFFSSFSFWSHTNSSFFFVSSFSFFSALLLA